MFSVLFAAATSFSLNVNSLTPLVIYQESYIIYILFVCYYDKGLKYKEHSFGIQRSYNQVGRTDIKLIRLDKLSEQCAEIDDHVTGNWGNSETLMQARNKRIWDFMREKKMVFKLRSEIE